MRPVILMLTPVIPSPTGGGSHIRAAAMLESLSRIGRVMLVHVESWGVTPDAADRAWCRSKAESVVVLQTFRLQDLPDVVADAMEAAGLGVRVDAMYVFRQVIGPIGLACRERFAPRVSVLDLDDDEVHLDRFLIALRRDRGDSEGAAALSASQDRRRTMRAILMSRFDRVFLSNPQDVDSFRIQYPSSQIELLPNVVVPAQPASHVSRDPMRMLFLGTLSYLPNEDGVGWFIEDILPKVRASQIGLHLRVAGVGLPEGLVPLLSRDGIDFAGEVHDVAHEYAAAGMLVVPLRAGSGTRIKILEAFSHGTPVVSTSVGAAGLGVTDGTHLLTADSPEAMAQCCIRLVHDGDLRDSLARNAARWVAEHHSIDVMYRIIANALGPIGSVQ